MHEIMPVMMTSEDLMVRTAGSKILHEPIIAEHEHWFAACDFRRHWRPEAASGTRRPFALVLCTSLLCLGCGNDQAAPVQPGRSHAVIVKPSETIPLPDVEAMVGKSLRSCQELLELSPTVCIRGQGQWRHVRLGREHFITKNYPRVCVDIFWSVDLTGEKIVREAKICHVQQSKVEG